jgi:hypothetical protein
MLEAVFLGVRGVLLPRPAFETAFIEAAATAFVAHGVPRDAFRAAARRRLAQTGPRALLSLSLQDLRIQLAPELVRATWLKARRAVPAVEEPSSFCAALRDLARRFEVGFVDAGPPEVLDGVLQGLRLDALPCRRLWTEWLGRLARPPRGLAFRWLTRRLGVRPSLCLYIAGTPTAWSAATEAGWSVWAPEGLTSDRPVDPWQLVDAVDRFEGMA